MDAGTSGDAAALNRAVALAQAQTSLLKQSFVAEQQAVALLAQGTAQTEAAASQPPPGPGKGAVVDVSA